MKSAKKKKIKWDLAKNGILSKRRKEVLEGKKMKLYCCGVDWQHEIGEAPDLEGKMPLFSDIETLKKNSPCWEECGIVELDVTLSKWIVKQDFGYNNE